MGQGRLGETRGDQRWTKGDQGDQGRLEMDQGRLGVTRGDQKRLGETRGGQRWTRGDQRRLEETRGDQDRLEQTEGDQDGVGKTLKDSGRTKDKLSLHLQNHSTEERPGWCLASSHSRIVLSPAPTYRSSAPAIPLFEHVFVLLTLIIGIISKISSCLKL